MTLTEILTLELERLKELIIDIKCSEELRKKAESVIQIIEDQLRHLKEHKKRI